MLVNMIVGTLKGPFHAEARAGFPVLLQKGGGYIACSITEDTVINQDIVSVVHDFLQNCLAR